MTTPKSETKLSEAEWKWYGYAGHFIGGQQCAYHLSTRIGAFLVSTVGDYQPNGERGGRMRIGAGDNAFFETYIFRCEGEDENGDPIVSDFSEIDGERYAESIDAERGHFCKKYAHIAALNGEKE